MKIKIIKSKEPTYWYAKRLGEIFTVEDYRRYDYIVHLARGSGTGYVCKEDCIEIVKEQLPDELFEL